MTAATSVRTSEDPTPQERLRHRLVRDFQPVWRQIDAAHLFGRRRLVWSDGTVVPQNVMIGLVMLLGSLEERATTETPTWSELADRRATDPDAARRFKRWMNVLTDYFNGRRPLVHSDVSCLARGLLRAQPVPDTSVETLTGELMAHAHPGAPGAADDPVPWAAVAAPVADEETDFGPFAADMPPALAPGFQRRDLQAAVTEALRFSSGSPVVLSGPPGVGKTQLAAAMLEDFSPEVVIWVSNASSRFAVLEAYVRAAQALGVAVSDPGDLEASARALMRYLYRADRDWWIVLDDVDEPSDLKDLTPGGRRGQILWLTRRRAVDFEGQSRRLIMVPGFSVEEGRLYLHERLGAAVERGELPRNTFDDVDGLLDDLGGTPLALSMAAGVLRENVDTCAGYRRQLAEQLDDLSGLFAPGQPAVVSQQSVVAAWAISLDRAARRDTTGLATRAALFTAVLNPSGVPAKVIATAAARRYLSAPGLDSGPDSGTRPATSDQLTRAWRALESYSLVSCRYQPETELKIGEVRMHTLNARMTRLHLGREAVAEAVRAAADALVELWGAVENDPRSNLDLRGHAIWLDQLRGDVLVSEQGLHPVLLNLGWSFGESGRPHRASRYFERLVDRVQPALGERHPQTEDVRYACGVWHRKEGKVRRSVRELTALRDGMIGSVDAASERRLIETEVELATSLGWSGQVHRARTDLAEVLVRARRVLPADDRTTMRVRHTHAIWTGRAGQWEEAMRLFAELLPDRQRLLGDNHVATLRTRMELAIWTGRAGDRREALLQLMVQHDDWIRVCGPDHPDTLRMLHNLALCRGRVGELDLAYRELRSVYRRRRQVLGVRHPDTLKSRQDLADVRGQRGDPEGAVFALLRLLRDQTAIQGPRAIETFRTRRQLATWLDRAGRPATAAAELDYLRADLARTVEPGHPELAEVDRVRAEIESQPL